MTFVSDDHVERVNRDLESVGVGLGLGVAAALRETAFGPKKIPRHALDRGDIDEGVARFRRGEVFVRQGFGIERVIIAEVFFLKLLAVNLVFLRELLVVRGGERVELANGLGGEGLAIYEEQESPGKLAFEKTIDLRHSEEGLARAGGHRHEEFAPATDDDSFSRDSAAALVVAEANDEFSRRVEQPSVRRLWIESEKRFQRRGCVELLIDRETGFSCRASRCQIISPLVA